MNYLIVFYRAFASSWYHQKEVLNQRQEVSYEDIIFKKNLWLKTISELGLFPYLVGIDVQYLGANQPKYIALALAQEDPIDPKVRKLFFKCLRKHTYDAFFKEVIFKQFDVTLNISALYQEDTTEIILRDPKLLFDKVGGLSTAVLYLGSKRTYRLGPSEIIGLGDDLPLSLQSIEQGFSINLPLSTGHPFLQGLRVLGTHG